MPSKVKFKINLKNGMKVTRIRLDATIREGNQIVNTSNSLNTLITTLETITVSGIVSVTVMGVGTSYKKGTLNIFYGNKKIFKEDRKFEVNSNGRFRFYDQRVKLI